MINILFVLLCFIADMVLSTIFPIDFALTSMIFVPAMGFVAVVLNTRTMNLTDALIFSFIAGAFYDLFCYDYFLLYAIIFSLIAFLTNIWSIHMTNTLIELVLLTLVTIFVKEVLVYSYMNISNLTNMTVMIWLQKRLFLTIVGNIIPCLLVIFGFEFKNSLSQQKERIRRKGEKIQWEQFR